MKLSIARMRQWGVPFDALAYVFGLDAMFWYRVWLAFGRPSLLGITVKDPQQAPTDMVADEKVICDRVPCIAAL